MDILLPNNIFTRILSSVLDDNDREKIQYHPSGLLSKRAIELKDSIVLIPTLDLLTYNDFFISQYFGISFDDSISNSYIYFNKNEKHINEIVLSGDASSNEAILTKILFTENYGIELQLAFEKTNEVPTRNRIIVGDRNYIEGLYNTGVSFSEEIIELISAPYVNFIFASQSKEVLQNFHLKYKDSISAFNPIEVLSKMNEQFLTSTKYYIEENLLHAVFYFDEQDLEGIKQILQLPFLHGIIKDLIDVKFV